jgi:hypothetical protein
MEEEKDVDEAFSLNLAPLFMHDFHCLFVALRSLASACRDLLSKFFSILLF